MPELQKACSQQAMNTLGNYPYIAQSHLSQWLCMNRPDWTLKTRLNAGPLSRLLRVHALITSAGRAIAAAAHVGKCSKGK